MIDSAGLCGRRAHGIARGASVSERFAFECLQLGAQRSKRRMLALPIREIFLLVHEAERHRREDEPDVEQHDRTIDALDSLGIRSVVEMLSKRARSVRYALSCRSRLGEIGACRLLIRERLP